MGTEGEKYLVGKRLNFLEGLSKILPANQGFFFPTIIMQKENHPLTTTKLTSISFFLLGLSSLNTLKYNDFYLSELWKTHFRNYEMTKITKESDISSYIF